MTQDQYNEIIKMLEVFHKRIEKKHNRPIKFISDEGYVLTEKHSMDRYYPKSGAVYAVITRMRIRKLTIVEAPAWLKSGKNINLEDCGPRSVSVQLAPHVITQIYRPTQSAKTFMEQLASIPQINAILSDPKFKV